MPANASVLRNFCVESAASIAAEVRSPRLDVIPVIATIDAPVASAPPMTDFTPDMAPETPVEIEEPSELPALLPIFEKVEPPSCFVTASRMLVSNFGMIVRYADATSTAIMPPP